MSTLVCFSADGADYEVGVEDVQEIAALGPIAALPGGSPGVAGLSELHGQVVTVIDLAERVQRPTPERPRMLVLGDGDRRRVAVRIDTATVADLPPAGDAALQRRFTRGRTVRSGRPRWIIDPAAVVDASTDDGVSPPWEMDVLVARRGPHDVALPMAAVATVVRTPAPGVPEAATPLSAPLSAQGPRIVVVAEGRRAALPCDRLLGERTITVQPIRLEASASGTYLGAAIEDGRVVLVLDPAGLVRAGGPTQPA